MRIPTSSAVALALVVFSAWYWLANQSLTWNVFHLVRLAQ